jgi:hypothetical protein
MTLSSDQATLINDNTSGDISPADVRNALITINNVLVNDATAGAAYGRALLALASQAALTALIANATTTATGAVELATDAETVTGTDTTRATTPSNIAAATVPRTGGASATIISGGSETDLTDGTGVIQVGASGGVNTGIDANEIQTRNGGAAVTLLLNPAGGLVAPGNNAATGDKIVWFSNTFGTGIESGTLTNWSANRHRWRVGGTSATSGTAEVEINATELNAQTNMVLSQANLHTNVAAADMNVPAGYSGYWPDFFEAASGVNVDIADTAILEVG